MAEVIVRAGAQQCFDLFCDVRLLRQWVPGLRRAKIARARADGLPLEVLYEVGETLSYSVIYDYDVAARRVTWEPGMGRRESVRGWADFTDEPGAAGCRMRYHVEGDRLDPDEETRFLAAFKAWVEAGPLTR